MNSIPSKYTFGRHGSFQLRYGWLTKGFLAFKEDSNVFASDDSTVTLGVGKNMVNSIAYWLRAADILGHNGFTRFGEKLLGDFDTYLEDDATLWLLHLKLAQNIELSTSIYWLFNHFHKTNFTTNEAFVALQEFIDTNRNTQTSENTIKMDISVILRMYAPHKSKQTQIDDMLESPLSLLKLIEYHDGRYYFTQSKRDQIPIEVIAYAIKEYFPNEKIIPVKELMYGEQLALNKVLKISEDSLLGYLESLVDKYPKDYQLREDAGIFQLHISSKVEGLTYLKQYYEHT